MENLNNFIIEKLRLRKNNNYKLNDYYIEANYSFEDSNSLNDWIEHLFSSDIYDFINMFITNYPVYIYEIQNSDMQDFTVNILDKIRNDFGITDVFSTAVKKSVVKVIENITIMILPFINNYTEIFMLDPAHDCTFIILQDKK